MHHLPGWNLRRREWCERLLQLRRWDNFGCGPDELRVVQSRYLFYCWLDVQTMPDSLLPTR